MIVVAALPILLLIYIYVIYPLFFNRLIKQGIPGPLHYKLTSFFILQDARNERRNSVLQRLHDKYGPVVMISPNEVSLNSQEFAKKVYLGNYPKEFVTKQKTVSGFYSQFGNFGQRNMFSTGDTKTHLSKKRPLQRLYSKSTVTSSQEFVKAKVSTVVKKIHEIGEGQNVDVYSLFIALAMDVVSGFEYGSKFATNFIMELPHTSDSLQVKRNLFHGFRDSSSMWFYTTLFPSLWTPVARWFGLEESVATAQDWIYEKFSQAMDSLVQGDSVDGDFKVNNVITTMFEKLKHEQYKSTNGSLPESRNRGHTYEVENFTHEQINDIASEIADHVAAGHETTGITLAYIFWELSRPCNRHWQELLKNEVGNKTDLGELDKLPTLHAIVQEACRLHAAIPGSEPRFVPPDHDLSVYVGGKKCDIPSGTMVSCQPWSMHRLPIFGSNVDKFKPERWLPDGDESEEEYKQRIQGMNNHMFVFGQGNRMCLGMHLALSEIKLCLAMLYSRFYTKISTDWCPKVVQEDCDIKVGYSELPMRYKGDGYRDLTDVEKMSMADSYTTRPLYDECWLQFYEYHD